MEEVIGDFSRGMKLPDVSKKYGLGSHTIRKYIKEEGIDNIKTLFPISKTAIYVNRKKLTKEEQNKLISEKLKERWNSKEGREKLLLSYTNRPSSKKKKDREN